MPQRTITSGEARNLVGATDWNRVKSLTDSEIEEAARTDRTAELPEPHELLQFKRKQRMETK